MELLFAIMIGVLFAGAVFSLLRRNLTRLIIGIMLMGQAINLLVFASGGLEPLGVPIIPEGEKTLAGAYADPLPQALVLTAIVIGFGLVVFTLALVQRSFKAVKSGDLNDFNQTDAL